MVKTITIYKPLIDGNKVTYRNSEGKFKTTYITDKPALDIVKNFNIYAFKDKNINKGNINRQDAIKILQDIYKNNKGTIKVRNGYSLGKLAQIKDLFELYMDKASEGGEKITQKEQSEILETIDNWFGSNKNPKRGLF